MRELAPALPWLGGAIVVIAGWLWGYETWEPVTGDGYRSYFDVFVPALTLLVGLPLCLLAGALLRHGPMRVLGGLVLLALASVLMGYWVSMAFFGGFCMDPGDACITNWPSRGFALVVPLACLAAGLAVRLHRTGST